MRSPRWAHFFNNNLDLVEDCDQKTTLGIDNFSHNNYDSAEARVNKRNLHIDIDNNNNDVSFIFVNKKIFYFVRKTI